MLNPFPIQFLALLAYTILRVIMGFIFVHLGIKHFRVRHDLKHAVTLSWFPFGLFSVLLLSLSEVVIGILLILGLYTQIAALVAIVIAIKMIIFNKKFSSPYIPSRMFYTLVLAVSLSLFITGAGAFAFDLPI